MSLPCCYILWIIYQRNHHLQLLYSGFIFNVNTWTEHWRASQQYITLMTGAHKEKSPTEWVPLSVAFAQAGPQSKMRPPLPPAPSAWQFNFLPGALIWSILPLTVSGILISTRSARHTHGRVQISICRVIPGFVILVLVKLQRGPKFVPPSIHSSIHPIKLYC